MIQIFCCFSGGPLPEELLPLVNCPVRLLWGEADPWEPLEMGKELFSPKSFPCIDEFVVLKNGYNKNQFSFFLYD